MEVKTRVYELQASLHPDRNLTQLAEAMGIAPSQVYRVLEGKRGISRKFIIGAVKAFPGYKLDELFYVE